MPKASPIQQSFNAGELSPLLYARTDFDRYKTGVKTLINYIPTIQGPLVRRSGFRFVAEVKDSSKHTRLIPFEFSTTQAYIIEMGENYFRFYRNNGSILNSAETITGITQANPAVVTITGHNLITGEHTELDNIGGMTELNNKRYQVTKLTANTFELDGVDSTSFTAFTSGGNSNRVYEIVHTYTESELDDVVFTQSADTLYLVHEDHKPATVTRTGHTAWVLDNDLLASTIGLGPDGPYLDQNSTSTTMVSSAATGAGVTVTASAITGINGGVGFVSSDVGRLIRMIDGSNWAALLITTFTNTTTVTATVIYQNAPTVATDTWRLGLYSDTDGWPSVVAFYEDRLFFGGSTFYPQRIDGSNSGDYTDFAPTEVDGTVLDSNGISFNLNANNVNAIQWIVDDPKGLAIGTQGSEWLVRSNNNLDALSPSNVNASRISKYGSSSVIPVKAGNAILHIQRTKLKLKELLFNFDLDGFKSSDLTLLSEHITESGLTSLSYQQEPNSIVWAGRDDGTLIGFTYEKEQNVQGWHNHILGGFNNVGKTTPADIVSVASIPASAEDRDELWAVVERYIDGGTVKYVEFLEQLWMASNDQVDSFFVDSGLTYDGAAATTFTGLDHLEGETVQILADGAVVPDEVVVSGSVTIETASSVVHMGLRYESDMETLAIEAGAADGTAQGKTKRIHRVILRVYQMLGLLYGPDSASLDEHTFRQGDDLMDAAVPLFSGDITIEWDGDYVTSGHIYMRQSDPLPGTILAIMPHLNTQDR